MADRPKSTAGFVSNVVVLSLLAVSAVATAGIWLLGDWANYEWWLTLTLRILWGCWAVAVLATALTRVTIFGWSFRRYFRWQGDGAPPPEAPRPIHAPWSKSPYASFSFTVSMVSVTGVTGLALAVMWILKPLTGDLAFQIVLGVLGSVWWVVMIILVLVRIAIFGTEKQKAMAAVNGAHPPAAHALSTTPSNGSVENGS
ncbi:MAG: hypothetical protein U0736_01210 [Gemmataceae bacterium]